MNTSEKPYDGETMSGTEENSNVSTEEMLSDVPDTYDYALRVSIIFKVNKIVTMM